MIRKLTAKKGLNSTMSPEEIRKLIEKRAYEVFCKRGTKSGDSISDWLRAEKEVKKELRIN